MPDLMPEDSFIPESAPSTRRGWFERALVWMGAGLIGLVGATFSQAKKAAKSTATKGPVIPPRVARSLFEKWRDQQKADEEQRRKDAALRSVKPSGW